MTPRQLVGRLLRKLGWRRPAAERIPRITSRDRIREVATKVTIRDDQTILVNGVPFFPNGIYYARDQISDPSGAGLQMLRELGLNTVFFGGGLDSAAELDRIHAAGLYVWYRPPGQLHHHFELLKAIVSRFAPHPAVLFWELDDEPILNEISFEQAAKGCGIVRALDPFHPILCNQWLAGFEQEEELRKWGGLADVHGFATYPVPLNRWGRRMRLVDAGWPHSIAVVGKQTALWRTWMPGKPIVPILQAWAWNSLEDGDGGYPSPHESRFMAYHAVIHGAKGLHHYGAVAPGSPNFACGIPPRMHDDLDLTHEEFQEARRRNSAFWTYYAAVTREIAEMSGVFTAPDSEWQIDTRSPIECRVKRHGDEDIVLLVNASSSPALADVRGLPPEMIEPFGVRAHRGVRP